jgi:hypothetical protein
MYDTLSLWLPSDKAPNIDLLAELPIKLNNLKETHNTNITALPLISGTYKHFFIKVREAGVYMRGSLNKYYHGTNVINLTYNESVKAIENLSEELDLPLKSASVFRIDFSANYSLTHSVNAYYEYLGSAPRYNKLIAPTGITYSNSRKAMVFYDKIAEHKKKKYFIPQEYQSENLLRYEMRFLKRLPQIFKRPAVTVSDLINEDFYRELLTRYKNEYEHIHKYNRIILSNKKVISVKDFENELMLLGSRFLGGEPGLLQLIEDSRHLGAFKNPMQVKRLKDKIKHIFSQPLLTTPSELISELSEKIKDHVKTQLNSF